MHEQVLRTGLNNSQIRYKKVMYFPDRGCVCVHTLLTLYVCATDANLRQSVIKSIHICIANQRRMGLVRPYSFVSARIPANGLIWRLLVRGTRHRSHDRISDVVLTSTL